MRFLKLGGGGGGCVLKGLGPFGPRSPTPLVAAGIQKCLVGSPYGFVYFNTMHNFGPILTNFETHYTISLRG